MNIKTPLAAALLMLASTAMAQPYALTNSLNCGSPYVFGLSAMPTASLMLTTQMPDSDTFNCSTPCNMNYGDTNSLLSGSSLGGTSSLSLGGNFNLSSGKPTAYCTPDQERARAAFTGECLTVSLSYAACVNYRSRILFPRFSNFSGPQELGENDAAAAVKAAAAAKPIEAASATEASPQSDNSNFVDPVTGSPVSDSSSGAQDKKAFERAQARVGTDGIKDVVPFKDGGYGIVTEDGNTIVCTRTQCNPPKRTSEVPQMQEWVANNNAGFAGTNKASPTPGDKGTGFQGATAGSYTPSSDGPSGRSAAYNDGVQASNDIAALGGPGGMRGAGAGDYTGGSGYSAARAPDAVVKVGTEEFKKSVGDLTTFTYSKFGEDFKRNKAEITAGALNDGARANSINVDSTMDASKHTGGIQAEANSAP